MTSAVQEPIAVANAGVVILGPYLPELHRRCGLLEGKVFRDFAAADRAVHLLQFLVDGNSRPSEQVLGLNKIMCGLAPAVAVTPHVELTDEEQRYAQSLLENVVQRWPRGGAPSVAGLRGSYLSRPGRLERPEKDWLLKVERRGWDVLLSELPWSFSTLAHAWMPEPLHVDWI
jgi:hypothetical protein